MMQTAENGAGSERLASSPDSFSLYAGELMYAGWRWWAGEAALTLSEAVFFYVISVALQWPKRLILLEGKYVCVSKIL